MDTLTLYKREVDPYIAPRVDEEQKESVMFGSEANLTLTKQFCFSRFALPGAMPHAHSISMQTKSKSHVLYVALFKLYQCALFLLDSESAAESVICCFGAGPLELVSAHYRFPWCSAAALTDGQVPRAPLEAMMSFAAGTSAADPPFIHLIT